MSVVRHNVCRAPLPPAPPRLRLHPPADQSSALVLARGLLTPGNESGFNSPFGSMARSVHTTTEAAMMAAAAAGNAYGMHTAPVTAQTSISAPTNLVGLHAALSPAPTTSGTTGGAGTPGGGDAPSPHLHPHSSLKQQQPQHAQHHVLLNAASVPHPPHPLQPQLSVQSQAGGGGAPQGSVGGAWQGSPPAHGATLSAAGASAHSGSAPGPAGSGVAALAAAVAAAGAAAAAAAGAAPAAAGGYGYGPSPPATAHGGVAGGHRAYTGVGLTRSIMSSTGRQVRCSPFRAFICLGSAIRGH